MYLQIYEQSLITTIVTECLLAVLWNYFQCISPTGNVAVNRLCNYNT
jgi:hypothetical protein